MTKNLKKGGIMLPVSEESSRRRQNHFCCIWYNEFLKNMECKDFSLILLKGKLTAGMCNVGATCETEPPHCTLWKST